jgi:hypothetical protein
MQNMIAPLLLPNFAPRNDVLRGSTFFELFMQQHLLMIGA